jgi:hypothetical protein
MDDVSKLNLLELVEILRARELEAEKELAARKEEARNKDHAIFQSLANWLSVLPPTRFRFSTSDGQTGLLVHKRRVVFHFRVEDGVIFVWSDNGRDSGNYNELNEAKLKMGEILYQALKAAGEISLQPRGAG